MKPIFTIIGIAAILIAAGILLHEKSKATLENRSTINAHNLPGMLILTSGAFSQGGTIPTRYTCEGDRTLNPPLEISGVPKEAKSLALIMDDPDVPKQVLPEGVFDHWVLFNISLGTKEIAEGKHVGTAGKNGRGENAYTGPCPPAQYEPSEHRYVFTLYALDDKLPLEEGASKADVLEAMDGHILDQAQLIGRYKKQNAK